MYKGDRSRKDNLVEFGWRLPSCSRQPPSEVPRVPRPRPAGGLRLGHAGTVRAEGVEGGRRADHPSDRPRRPADRGAPPHGTHRRPGRRTSSASSRDGDRALVTTLTKATSEELANYLAKLGLKVRYLHSEVETLKRVEVLRDLRLGQFDVLVGINLLREGLDLPEVSFVAILDADKEGYLRSETSIVQTAGRASRNMRGKVVLYADRTTGSMRRAIDEMARRRTAQVEYNRSNGIVPESVQKEVRALLGTAEGLLRALDLGAREEVEGEAPAPAREP